MMNGPPGVISNSVDPTHRFEPLLGIVRLSATNRCLLQEPGTMVAPHIGLVGRGRGQTLRHFGPPPVLA